MEFKTEKLKDIFTELLPLLFDHKNEVCVFGDDIELQPDWKVYYQLEDCGVLRIITARIEGNLVGYYIYLKHRHLHYNFIVADNDILYLDPKYRSRYAVLFFKAVEKFLEVDGINMETISIKAHVDYRGLAEHLGYKFLEYKYFKRIS